MGRITTETKQTKSELLESLFTKETAGLNKTEVKIEAPDCKIIDALAHSHLSSLNATRIRDAPKIASMMKVLKQDISTLDATNKSAKTYRCLDETSEFMV